MIPVGSNDRTGGFTLVLGAGGRVGMASHAGVLRALDEVGGLDPARARLVIGTSAGSVVGALLRLGWSTPEIWALATRTRLPDHRDDVASDDLFGRSWTNPSQLVRRALGSVFVVSRSLVRIPLVPVPELARRVFPGGFLSLSEEESDVGTGIGDQWPDALLWLCAVDIETGRRVVLGRRGDQPPLAEAVLASCAIPGYYQPVRLDGRTLVDGGVHSTTNLDLAGRVETPLVIASAPMAYDPRRGPGPLARASRRPVNRGLARDRMALRSAGRSVLLLRPGREELDAHGLNPMRGHGLEPVAVAAYDATARFIAGPRAARLLTAAAEAPTSVASAS